MTKQDLFDLTGHKPNQEIYNSTKKAWDCISKPLDGLGDFETLICKIYASLGTTRLSTIKKVVVIMCADNGIVEEGVSQCGQENTYLVTKLLGEDKSTASTMARFANVDCIPVDIGVNNKNTPPGVRDYKISQGTNNFLDKPAMTEEEVLTAIDVGIVLAKELKENGYHLILTGEMGIGNTTTSTALLCALTDALPEQVTGRGAGLSDEGLSKKVQVIREALSLYHLNQSRTKEEIFHALCCVGGLDIAGLTGLFIGGALYNIPVVIDGLISAISAYIAESFVPGCREYMIPSHSGKEKGVERILTRLKLDSYLNGNMALGEGTGAIMLMPVLDLVHDFFLNATTFDEGNIESYQRTI